MNEMLTLVHVSVLVRDTVQLYYHHASILTFCRIINKLEEI